MPRWIELHPDRIAPMSIPRPRTARLRLTNGPWKMPMTKQSYPSNEHPGGPTRILLRRHIEDNRSQPARRPPFVNVLSRIESLGRQRPGS
jgi:hypothetical protein